jgi:predicted transcriptional regulator
MMDDFDDDYLSPSNYKGFDLSDIDEKDLPDVMEKIDLIHENMKTIKELCKKLISIYEPIENNMEKLKKVEPDVHQKIMEEAIKLYGDEKGRRLVELILGKLDQESIRLQIAKAKAFIISYERQFEDESVDPIHPSEFEESDVFKIMQKLTGGKNPLPTLSSS